MRFQRLDLIRYGAYADRSLDFGTGKPDLHLIVGPNEAGKSTLLQAISDLLFGIGGQTSQAWRYDYQQLRIRALVEHDNGVLDLTRRKGNKDTLLRADGSAYTVDPLLPLLGGIDRTGFERMFGLDHAKLRDGGRAILEGRDDAARIVLEAGTGLSGIGRELTRLDDLAGTLFKQGGQIPQVNRLMRERADALAAVRQTSLSDSEISALKERRASAEEQRQSLIDEGTELDRRHATLERLERVRPLLMRLRRLREELGEVGDLRELGAEAGGRLAGARTERTTASELLANYRLDLDRANQTISSISLPETVLAEQAAIEALEARRPVIESNAAELERRSGELERATARLAAARSEAGLSADAALPSAGWRRRAGQHLEARRSHEMLEGRLEKSRRELTAERDRLTRELQSIPEPVGRGEIDRALAAWPAEIDERIARARSDAERRAARAERSIAELQPWAGSAEALAKLPVPTAAAVAKIQRTIEAAEADELTARRQYEGAEDAIIREQAKLSALEAGGELPTGEAIAEARRVRNNALDDIRRRLGQPRAADDASVVGVLADAIAHADLLADRRESEASRVAQHAVASAALKEAQALLDTARQRREDRQREAEEASGQWTEQLAALGFASAIAPGDFAAWVSARDRALTEIDELADARAEVSGLENEIANAAERLARALKVAGGEVPADVKAILPAAREASARLQQAANRREVVLRDLRSLEAREAGIAAEFEELGGNASKLARDLAELVSDAGLAPGATATQLSDALEALSAVADEASSAESIARQVHLLKGKVEQFETEARALLARLSHKADGSLTAHVRALAAERQTAIADRDRLRQAYGEFERLTAEMARAEQRVTSAQGEIDELMKAAGALDEAALDVVVAGNARRAGLRTQEADTKGEIDRASGGMSFEALSAEVDAIASDEAEAELSRIRARRAELASQREDIARTLAEAEQEASRISRDAPAAEAQQLASELSSTLAASSERFIEAASAAALLRWLVEKHRSTSQAPLIERAGELFAQITKGAFVGLKTGYDAADRPVIVGCRADGLEVGVDAMSEGTRDQLYLALRLGSIEGRAGAQPLPLVCDDLLITADDGRAAAMLNTLSAASSWTQVLVFTHHEHLVDLATRSIGEDAFRLHRLVPAIEANLHAVVA